MEHSKNILFHQFWPANKQHTFQLMIRSININLVHKKSKGEYQLPGKNSRIQVFNLLSEYKSQKLKIKSDILDKHTSSIIMRSPNMNAVSTVKRDRERPRSGEENGKKNIANYI